ncbi:MAG: SDR family oxidoreductase, partial [Pseudomonadales bacterium]|nr:SDR family oxidoreductase [Pseudomonadales bacterium]
GHRTKLAWFGVLREVENPDTVASLSAWLDERMPSQSVPSAIRVIDDLPLMPSGKVDQRRLLDLLRMESEETRVPDDASLTSVVQHAFMEVLEQTDVEADSDFFALGGDSLLAIALCGLLHGRTGRRVRVADVYECRTPGLLSDRLAQTNAARKSGWRLPVLEPDVSVSPHGGEVESVLVTGATGLLGTALTRHLLEETKLKVAVLLRGNNQEEARKRIADALGPGVDFSRLECVVGDLSEPEMSLGKPDYDSLAQRIDAIVHGAADLNMFASYETLAETNVEGTRKLLGLAMHAGARFCHVSSSAVFPLDASSGWNETSYGYKLAESLAEGLARSDGYSRSKLAAEALVWQAFDLGLQFVGDA